MHTEDSVFENHVTGDVNVGREAIGRAITGIFAVFPDLSSRHDAHTSATTSSSRSGRRAGTHEGTMTRSGIEVPADRHARSSTRAWT